MGLGAFSREEDLRHYIAAFDRCIQADCVEGASLGRDFCVVFISFRAQNQPLIDSNCGEAEVTLGLGCSGLD